MVGSAHVWFSRVEVSTLGLLGGRSFMESFLNNCRFSSLSNDM